MLEVINIGDGFAAFDDLFSPKIVADPGGSRQATKIFCRKTPQCTEMGLAGTPFPAFFVEKLPQMLAPVLLRYPDEDRRVGDENRSNRPRPR